MGDAAEDAERKAQQEQEEEGRTPEAQAAEPTPAPESEVRPEELTQGIDEPTWESALPADVVAELRKPLDPNRVRRRRGRGQGQFEYLAGHDVKRRANELFGFGNWGYEIVSQTEDEAVPVTTTEGREGWHIVYRTIVRVNVAECMPFSDVGYGDGVEYGPAAKATARELAMKESATDALKRAFTGWGDQFGLILYAKDDEKKRIDRDRNQEQTSREAVRVDHDAGVPKNWTQINEWAEGYGPSLGWAEWVAEAALALFGVDDSKELSVAQKKALGHKAAGAIVALRESHEVGVFPPPTRSEVREAWAKVLDGTIIEGPPWRMSPDETDREPFPEPEPAPEEAAASTGD